MPMVLCCGAMYHLDILAEVPLKAAKQDLPLARLEAIQHGGDGALKVSPRKQDQLLQFSNMGGQPSWLEHACKLQHVQLHHELWFATAQIAGTSRCQLDM